MGKWGLGETYGNGTSRVGELRGGRRSRKNVFPYLIGKHERGKKAEIYGMDKNRFPGGKPSGNAVFFALPRRSKRMNEVFTGLEGQKKLTFHNR